MAIIKVGAPLAGIRGTLGGITYSENGSGTYAKQWSIPSNPRTPHQTAERGFLARMPSLWAALSDAQRADWRSFAADPAQEKTNPLGEKYYASGYNWFCQCNVSLLRVGRATIQPSPTQAQPATPTILDFRVCVAGTEADLCVCGVASASTERFPGDADKAFDDSLDPGDSWSTSFGNTTGWLRYNLCVPANVKRYRIYPQSTLLATAPATWDLQVWSGGAWQAIHSVTGEAGWAAQWYDFYCPNEYTETDYRINIGANQGDPNYLRICEMELYAGDEGSSVVIYPEDAYDNAPSYDLVLHVSMGNSIGMSVQYPGFYEVLAQQSPGRWYATFQAELEAVFGTILMERSWYARLYRQTQEGYRSAAQAERTVTIG